MPPLPNAAEPRTATDAAAIGVGRRRTRGDCHGNTHKYIRQPSIDYLYIYTCVCGLAFHIDTRMRARIYRAVKSRYHHTRARALEPL